jgi:hypothetical protein
MKRRPGRWFEMATRLGSSYAWEAMKIEPECVKLNNLYCLKPLPGNGSRRREGWKRLGVNCDL